MVVDDQVLLTPSISACHRKFNLDFRSNALLGIESASLELRSEPESVSEFLEHEEARGVGYPSANAS
jgi:hypothetical protein